MNTSLGHSERRCFAPCSDINVVCEQNFSIAAQIQLHRDACEIVALFAFLNLICGEMHELFHLRAAYQCMVSAELTHQIFLLLFLSMPYLPYLVSDLCTDHVACQTCSLSVLRSVRFLSVLRAVLSTAGILRRSCSYNWITDRLLHDDNNRPRTLEAAHSMQHIPPAL